MPVASSSRRRTNGRAARQPSSDGIEEDQPTQHHGEDEDVDENEDEDEPAGQQASPTRPARFKKGKLLKGRHSGPKERAGDNEDEEDDDDGRIDVENFKDQPLAKEDAGKVAGIIKDWEMIRKQSQSGAGGWMASIGVSMADLMDEEEAKKSLAELDIVMKEILDIEEEMILNEATVSDLHQQLAQGVVVETAVEMYEKGVKKRLNEYRARTTRQKYAKKVPYQEFRQQIYEAQNPKSGIPPITEFIPKEEGDESDDDDDLEIGGVTQDYKCPISLTTLVKPMTSRLCNHSFSESAIRDFLGPSRTLAKKCPASGCTKKICLNDLQSDKTLEKRVRAAERRMQRQERDSDGDEVIE